MFKLNDWIRFSSDAAFAVDRELRVVAWNEQAENLLGYSASEVLGQPCHAIIRALLPDGEPLCVPNCQAKGCFCRCQPVAFGRCRVVHKDGTKLWASLSSLVVPPTHDGEVNAFIFVRPLKNGEAQVGLAPTTVLSCFTLGHFSLGVAERRVDFERWQRKQSLTLLKYLVTLRGRAVHRERLIERLWPGVPERRGRERLKVTVYALRRALGGAGVAGEIIVTCDHSYLLKREHLWVDADAYEQLVKTARRLERQGHVKRAISHYQQAQTLYRGHYLEEDLYDDLCAEERERLKEICLNALNHTAKLHAAEGDFDQAAQVCRRALVQEPCLESFHRMLMDYLRHQGKRAQALSQFATCRRMLAQRLGVAPSPVTLGLYQKILNNQ